MASRVHLGIFSHPALREGLLEDSSLVCPYCRVSSVLQEQTKSMTCSLHSSTDTLYLHVGELLALTQQQNTSLLCLQATQIIWHFLTQKDWTAKCLQAKT